MKKVENDIRWIQRFSNFKKAYHQLAEAVELMEERELSRLEKQGVVQAFEYTHELAWKTLKDFLEMSGALDLYGSRDVTIEAFKVGLIDNGETWMEMIKSRNLTSHTYDEEILQEMVYFIQNDYFMVLRNMKNKMDSLNNLK